MEHLYKSFGVLADAKDNASEVMHGLVEALKAVI